MVTRRKLFSNLISDVPVTYGVRLRTIEKFNTTGTCFRHKHNTELIAIDVVDEKHIRELIPIIDLPLLAVIIDWVMFEFGNLSQCFGFLKAMFGIGGQGFYNGQVIYYLYTNAIVFIILIICSTPIALKSIEWVKVRFKVFGNTVVPLLYLIIMLLSTAYLVNESYNPFLYFRF